MTRNQSKRSQSSSSALPAEDTIINLPDLSAFQDDEKQHILNVLVRDETLRLKHLSRFMQLRKEVAELEQKPVQTSASICARCQTPFGYIFNTGDACPKCSAKVCRQCRLMYNVNDNGWLCQLCCKQMQLMSYSGEWIYSIRSNLRKDSALPSQSTHKSLQSSTFTRNTAMIPSSESEPENIPSPSISHHFPVRSTTPPPSKTLHPNRMKMIVQRSVDEQRMKIVRERMDSHPLDLPSTQPLPRKTRDYASIEKMNSPAVETPTKTGPVARRIQALKALHNEYAKKRMNTFDFDRIPSDSTTYLAVNKKKSNRSRLKIHRQYQSASRGSDQDLTSPSTSTEKSSRKRVSVSMQSLRDTVHRIPHQPPTHYLLTSKKHQKSELSIITDQERVSLKIPRMPSGSSTRTNTESLDLSFNESKTNLYPLPTMLVTSHSSDDLSPVEPILAVIDNRDTENSRYNQQENAHSTKVHRLQFMHHLQRPIDSDEDIDSRFEKARLGSEMSINSSVSETKTRFDLETSGMIELKVSFSDETYSLDIFIKKCTNLESIKPTQTLNPYVKIYLLPGKSKVSKRKTSVKKDTADPVFAETLRYTLSEGSFSAHVLWISVWSQTSLGRNDLLGEFHLPLINCTLDRMDEHRLFSRRRKEKFNKSMELSNQTCELYFDLEFFLNAEDDEVGTIQINAVRVTAISYSKCHVATICKGLLLPDKIKRKLSTRRRGLSPSWDGSLCWEQMHRGNLPSVSLEISIWSRERFRQVMIGYVRLSLSADETDSKSVRWFDKTSGEQAIWEAFVEEPTKRYHCQLPLRLATGGNK